MDRESTLILQQLVNQWSEVKATLQKLSNVAEVRPDDGYQVFRADLQASADVVAFDLQPVVFNLPERASNYTQSNLFIVVVGRLALKRQAFIDDRRLLTHGFGTHAAYFRRSQGQLFHVYGVHHDFSLDELGHPAFHSQMHSFSNLACHITAQYEINDPVVDRIEHVLRTVRMPSAQMDIFSLFLQICADHLLFERSGPEEKLAFNALLEKGTFLQGAGARFPRLGTDAARACYRAQHWYPVIA